MRTIPLTVIEGGINRLLTKGGARADDLYDLVNAYVTKARKIKPRPGTERVASLPTGTVGLCAFDGGLHVFASASVDLSAYPDFTLHVLKHPYNQNAVLTTIHFAEPFLGALYVVGEFNEGQIYHYWLQDAETWEASTEYKVHQFVLPTTENGYAYRASRYGNPYPSWSAGVLRTAGNGSSIDPSRIEPTTYNGYYYEAIATEGDNPRSGDVEPTWPTNSGETVVENTDGWTPTATPTPPDPPELIVPQDLTLVKYER